jgi:hypothetical protein
MEVFLEILKWYLIVGIIFGLWRAIVAWRKLGPPESFFEVVALVTLLAIGWPVWAPLYILQWFQRG